MTALLARAATDADTEAMLEIYRLASLSNEGDRDDARQRGIRRIEVTANPHAMKFYEAVGFRRIATAETELREAPRMALEVGAGPGSARIQP